MRIGFSILFFGVLAGLVAGQDQTTPPVLTNTLNLTSLSCVATPAPAANAWGCVMSLNQNAYLANTNNKAVIQVMVSPPSEMADSSRLGINLCIVLDASGSMQGGKLDQGKIAACKAVEQLDTTDVFSMIVLGENVRTLIPSQAVTEPALLLKQIQALEATGTTSLFSGLSRAASELRKQQGKDMAHRIIIISDGDPTEGPSSVRRLSRLSTSFGKENISVSTIGIGEGFNEALMAEMAERSDGNFYFAETENDLPNIIESEVAALLSVIAQDVKVSIHCLNGVQPNRIIGRNGFIKDQQVDVYFNQLLRGHPEQVLVEVDMPPQLPNNQTRIANGEICFRNGNLQAQGQLTSNSDVCFSLDPSKITYNNPVQQAAVLTETALAVEQAIEASNYGEVARANEILGNSRSNLWTYGIRLNDPVLQQQSKDINELDEELQRSQSFGNLRQKQLRQDSYRMRQDGGKPGKF